MITGDSPLAFGQAVTLFGRRKGSGESVWDIKRKIGTVTPRSHMQYLTFCDPHNAADAVGHSGKTVSSRDVVMSGLHDTIGLYDRRTAEHSDIADVGRDVRHRRPRVGDAGLLHAPVAGPAEARAALPRAGQATPGLLVLDEPTHALSRSSRDRFLNALQAARDAADVWPCFTSRAHGRVKP